MRKWFALMGLLFVWLATLGASCGELPPIPIPIPPPDNPSPCPEPSPCPQPTPCPECPVCPSPSPVPSPEPSPTPEPSPSPEPTPPPGPVDCKKFKPTTTGFSFLACTLNGKLVCGGGQGKKCDCNGAGCTFDLPVGAACDGDSTPRHDGDLPNWKTCNCMDHGDELPCNEWPVCVDGKVERSEYPPRPAYGWECAGTTKWSADAGVDVNPEGDGYGARLKFPKAGTFKVKVCRADGSHCTEKKARVK